jgi:hypothetical protein
MVVVMRASENPAHQCSMLRVQMPSNSLEHFFGTNEERGRDVETYRLGILTSSSNLAGYSTGRSPGCAPLRIRPAGA